MKKKNKTPFVSICTPTFNRRPFYNMIIKCFLSQTYGNQETNLISSFDIKTNLSSSSYLEFFVYDNNKNILDVEYNFTQYTIQNDGQSPGNDGDVSEIILDFIFCKTYLFNIFFLLCVARSATPLTTFPNFVENLPR